MLLTISNLYPYPKEMQRGLFNAQLFAAMSSHIDITNLCLVPEWRIWSYKGILNWRDVYDESLGTCYVPYFYLPVLGRNYSWRHCYEALARLGDLFAECDVVLATWLYPDCVAAVEMAKMYKKRVWLKVHGSDRFHLNSVVRRRMILDACDYAEGVICNAEFMKNALGELGVPAEKLHVIPNGVDTELFRYRDRNDVLSKLCNIPDVVGRVIEERKKVVLFVGHLVDVKGADVLLEAWAKVVRLAGSVAGCLVIVGDGVRRASLKRMADKLGIAESVLFVGECSHDDIALWMNVADCLCLPSRSEGMPNVVLEALASGLPVVATDVGDCRQVLEEAECCCIVSVEDGDDLCAGLSGVLGRGVDRVGLAGRQERRLSWDKCGEKYLGLMT